MLSPDSPRSSCFLNVSIPTIEVLTAFGEYPTISTSSPILTDPVSIVPVTTQPRP